ncbi:MAG: 3-hydroxy-5-phosphonooxypentane-2,4-dione thiolase [Planctomycetia bacterium]|nr:3-hydroxy-5-phosphonooxypentane-2,4-dione thiolase [Planctomycetia bacterium]
MADAQGNKIAKNYYVDVKPETKGFYLKGLTGYDWGVQDRMTRMFDKKSGHTVMLAFDHGYIMGPTAGLERMDISVKPLIEYADVLMCTRGALRSCVPSDSNKPIALRCTTGATLLTELSYECLGVDIEDACRVNASAMAIQVFAGAQYEHNSLDNLAQSIDRGLRFGIPTLGVTAVGKDMARDSRYLGLATRVCAEIGCQFVKTYYCENFEEVAAGCPVPIVIAGGKKVPEKDALELAFNAIRDGACGVDMGRNIFQAECPVSMLKAVREVVHNGATVDQAYDMYRDLMASK